MESEIQKAIEDLKTLKLILIKDNLDNTDLYKSFTQAITALKRQSEMETLYLADDWDEDFGDVLWWKLPVDEPPYIGSPLCCDWPGYHTHWSKLPSSEVVEKWHRELEGYECRG